MLLLSRSLFILFLSILWLGFVQPAPYEGSVKFALSLDRPSDLPELQYRLLQAQQEQDDLEVIRMQLMQLNLLKLLIALDVFILICVYFYGENREISK
ncbi:uncharacterized protein [Drosophila kikkawai]|uniref:Uncharacterized protein n=1 Tax=Drosophila kikkawai TaxID=30033 RepID=A0A6P4J0V7_DROKI|nr:uncharacterized protein LOC108083622 [Drosophila kikkawai]